MNKKISVYTDGGSRGNPGRSAAGIVFQKENEEIFFKKGIYLGIMTNNMAEYLAFINACWEIKELNFKPKKISFYLDSMLIVKQMNKEWKIKDEKIRNLSNSAFLILKSLNIEYDINHVYREKNKEADSLVNQVLDCFE